MLDSVKESIYHAVYSLLEEKGVHFSTADVAKKIKKSKRTIYSLFDSKEDMLEKAIDHAFATITKADRQILRDTSFSYEERMSKYFLDMSDTYDCSLIMQNYNELKRRFPKLGKKIECILSAMHEEMMGVLITGMEEGKLRKVNINVLELILTDTLDKIMTAPFLTEHSLTFEEGAQALYNIVLNGLFVNPTNE
jgi:AcrR family transcriptional regulator